MDIIIIFIFAAINFNHELHRVGCICLCKNISVFVRDVPFLTYLPGLYKIIRGASFGGIVVGIGCWYVYYRNEHS